jgi:hypothetical protein
MDTGHPRPHGRNPPECQSCSIQAAHIAGEKGKLNFPLVETPPIWSLLASCEEFRDLGRRAVPRASDDGELVGCAELESLAEEGGLAPPR